MELEKKVQILADGAKYDVSCSSSGSKRQNVPGGIGNGATSGICHSWSEDGRCISLLKILYTNHCIYDCAYCINRSSNDVPRAIFTPQELADLTIAFYRRNYIEGLFLSSGVVGSPDYTMERLNQVLRLLRKEHRFNGYIHVKAIPGADPRLVSEAGHLADRMSVNIELPSENSLQLLAPQKTKGAILHAMNHIARGIVEYKADKKTFRNTPGFAPAGQSTQLIIGATADTDQRILRLSENLYQHYRLKRVYYSAYMPINTSHRLLPALVEPPTNRENRLYQADWLMRFYGFQAEEMVDDRHPHLDLTLDPKSSWALRNLELFPVEINTADYTMLLRIPGIGVLSAKKIIQARQSGALHFDQLKNIGVVLKRARHFMTCKGRYYGERGLSEERIRAAMLPKKFAEKGLQLQFPWG